MILADCTPGQRLLWRSTRRELDCLKHVRVVKRTASRVVVLVKINGVAVRRAVKPVRLFKRMSSAR